MRKIVVVENLSLDGVTTGVVIARYRPAESASALGYDAGIGARENTR